MSKKRTASESNNDEQTTEGSDPVSQQQDIDAKRAKLISLSDTTLQDLPIELLECILVKVVVIEVTGMKLAKSRWKEKVDLVIDRLRTVCSQWSSICATNYFRNEIHRTLDRTAQETNRLEMLHQYPIQYPVFGMTAVQDEIFMLCRLRGDDFVIDVLDCNNMGEVKDVIQLPGICPTDIAGCNVSNCVYALNSELDTSSKSDSILRITKAEKHQFKISPWITYPKLSLFTISVSANGSLIALSRPNPTVVSIYAVDGSLQHKVTLSPDIYGFRYVRSAIQKSDGNLVLVLEDDQCKRHLMEINTFGSVVRRFQSSLRGQIDMNFVDIYGSILINNFHSFELLDSELNRLDFSGLQPYDRQFFCPPKLHFNSERNETHVMCIYHSTLPRTFLLAIFRLI